MKALTLSTLFIISTLFVAAQQVLVKQWDRRFGGSHNELFSGLLQTMDSGYMLGGFSFSGTDGDKTEPNWDTSLNTSDYWIVKIDSAGNKKWDKRFGGFGEDNLAQVRQTFDGGYLLGGVSYSGMGGDKSQPNRGGQDYWIVKVDSAGNKKWDKRFGGSYDDELFTFMQTRDSGYILGGYSNSPASGDKSQGNWDSTYFYYDFWVVKTDSVGNKQWDKRFGGIQDEFLTALVQTTDGGYILAGQSMSGISGDKTQANWVPLDYNYWVVKIDSAGNKLWDKRYGYMGDYLTSILSVSDGGFVVGGYSWSGIGGDKTQPNWSTREDYWIIRIDSAGNKLWDKDYGALGDDQLWCLASTNDGGYLLSGNSWSAVASGDKSQANLGAVQTWVLKTDSSGNKQWDKTVLVNGRGNAGQAIQTSDGCYAIACYTDGGISGYKTQPNRDPSDTTYDYWIVKFCDSILTTISEPPTTQTQIQVYPNPFSSDIAILVQKENLKEATFTITNMLGQIVYTKQENNLSPTYTKMLDLSYLPNGIYMLQVEVQREKIVRRIVKQ